MTTAHATSRQPWTSEQGAILIQVGLAILILAGFCAFVLDFGVMWLARGQAQNAADAGALAGAVARGFDDPADSPAASGPAYQAAYQAARANPVIGEAPGVAVSWTCPPFVSGARCVEVDVFRDGTNGSSTLPTYFGPLVGTTTQKVRATATAAAVVANASDCLRPWGVSDRWLEQNVPATPDTFDRYSGYDKKKGTWTLEKPGADLYMAPTKDSTGSGYSIAANLGTEVQLKIGQAKDTSQVSNGWFLAVDLPDGSGGFASGGSTYRTAIGRPCSDVHAPVTIGTVLPTETGDKSGPTTQGVQDLLALDPGAVWVGGTDGKISGSCAETRTCPNGELSSPRIVAVAVFDPDLFQKSQVAHDWSYCPGGGDCVKITNIFGFFVEGVDNSGNVNGRLMRIAGTVVPGGWEVGTGSAFLYTFQVVR